MHAFWLLLMTMVVGCQLGRPPATGVLSVGPIDAPVAEPGLQQALTEALSSAIAGRGLAGEGRALAVEVLSARSALVASAEEQVHRAALSVAVTSTGSRPQRAVFSGERVYIADPGAPLAASAARAAAFSSLASALMVEAVEWAVFAPGVSDGG